MTSGGDEPAGLELLPRLAGLWSGPATMTPLGTFKLMNMDVRAASGQVLFSARGPRRDEQPALRLRGRGPGGRADAGLSQRRLLPRAPARLADGKLVEHEGEALVALLLDDAQGCDYIDARWTFSAADALVFDVKVKGQAARVLGRRRARRARPAGPVPRPT
jgi:hypothetical protein